MSYLRLLLMAFVVAFAVFGLRVGEGKQTAIKALPLSVILGFICSKLFYVMLLMGRTLLNIGFSSFLRMRPEEFSFFGAGVGVLLGVIAAAWLTGENVPATLDRFAPAGAILAALARFAEISLDTLGVGDYCGMGDEPLNFFPFAVVAGEWGEYYRAVFMLEAVLALGIAILYLITNRNCELPLMRTIHVLFFLCLTQIFCESRRALSMKWGFVRVEQVLCAACVAAIILILSQRSGKRVLPICGAFACIVGMVGVEFALDKTEIPHLILYGVMIALLIVLAVIEQKCAVSLVKKRREEGKLPEPLLQK